MVSYFPNYSGHLNKGSDFSKVLRGSDCFDEITVLMEMSSLMQPKTIEFLILTRCLLFGRNSWTYIDETNKAKQEKFPSRSTKIFQRGFI